jgi:hypothetical protein
MQLTNVIFIEIYDKTKAAFLAFIVYIADQFKVNWR